MPLSTYAELQVEIADFLNRDDLATSVQTFIRLAEVQMQRELRHWRMEASSSVPMAGQFVALPSDYQTARRMNVAGESGALSPLSAHEMQSKREVTSTGTPCFYAITNQQIELYPTPSSGDLEVFYLSTIPALTDTNASNWLLVEAPDAYLYGALLQSAPYLKQDTRLPVWSSFYAGAISSLNMNSDDAKYGGGLTINVGASLP